MFRGSEAASLDGTDEAPILLVNGFDVRLETAFLCTSVRASCDGTRDPLIQVD